MPCIHTHTHHSLSFLLQGEAIAMNLREMFNFRVPIISIVIGEGGSGGALAIGCANRMLIMENAVYYVASPEACAAILWKSRDKAGVATEALKITPRDLVGLGVMDEIVPEPLGAAHTDPMGAFPAVREAVLRHYRDYVGRSATEIMADRYMKFRHIGVYEEFLVAGGDVEAARAQREEVGAGLVGRGVGGGGESVCGGWVGHVCGTVKAGDSTSLAPGGRSRQSVGGAGPALYPSRHSERPPAASQPLSSPPIPPFQAPGAYTKAGTWAPTEADARYIEKCADADEKWEQVCVCGGGEGAGIECARGCRSHPWCGRQDGAGACRDGAGCPGGGRRGDARAACLCPGSLCTEVVLPPPPPPACPQSLIGKEQWLNPPKVDHPGWLKPGAYRAASLAKEGWAEVWAGACLARCASASGTGIPRCGREPDPGTQQRPHAPHPPPPQTGWTEFVLALEEALEEEEAEAEEGEAGEGAGFEDDSDEEGHDATLSNGARNLAEADAA